MKAARACLVALFMDDDSLSYMDRQPFSALVTLGHSHIVVTVNGVSQYVPFPTISRRFAASLCFPD